MPIIDLFLILKFTQVTGNIETEIYVNCMKTSTYNALYIMHM